MNKGKIKDVIFYWVVGLLILVATMLGYYLSFSRTTQTIEIYTIIVLFLTIVPFIIGYIFYGAYKEISSK